MEVTHKYIRMKVEKSQRQEPNETLKYFQIQILFFCPSGDNSDADCE